MNYNISANENFNKDKYVKIDQTYYTNMKDYIRKRRAEIVYAIEQQEYAEKAEQKSINDLRNWAESKD